MESLEIGVIIMFHKTSQLTTSYHTSFLFNLLMMYIKSFSFIFNAKHFILYVEVLACCKIFTVVHKSFSCL